MWNSRWEAKKISTLWRLNLRERDQVFPWCMYERTARMRRFSFNLGDSMIRNAALTVLLVSGLTLFGQGLFGQEMFAQESDSKDTNIDVRSPVGDLHLGNDVDAKKIGV